MRERMVKRGPDGAGLWCSEDGRVGLAHRRLSILDLSEGGAQPMASDDGAVHIVFNGEIYNFRELRHELEQQGDCFRSHSDTEVLIALYRRHGRAMLTRLRGMFAFALWDVKAQGLLLARDHFGIKPLYLADDGKTVRVASQVKALLAGNAIDTTPDPAGRVGFMLWGHVPEPFTLYRSIKALPAGSWMWVDGTGTSSGRYFDMTSELATIQPADGDLGEALRDTVRAHLVADVKVGVFLSSGLDSSLLCALASNQQKGDIEAVTIGFAEFEGGPNDEVPLARRIAQHYHARHHVTRVTADDFMAAREQLVEDMDQPSIDGVNTWFVARAARRHGLKVALSGLGGDELFAGYASFRQNPRINRWLSPLRPVPAVGRFFRQLAAPLAARRGNPKMAGLLEYGTRPEDTYLLRRGLFMPWELPKILDPDLVRQGWGLLETQSCLRQTIDHIQRPRSQIQALETSWYMRNQLLRDSDWAGMAHSLEIRTPLVDIGLFRAVLPLVAGKTPPGKLQMASTAQPALPDDILYRRKTGFFVPVPQWMGVGHLRGWAQWLADQF